MDTPDKRVDLTIYWNDDSNPTYKNDVTIDEGITLLTVIESNGDYSRIPLVNIKYYDVEV
jgi:hypothetical protein